MTEIGTKSGHQWGVGREKVWMECRQHNSACYFSTACTWLRTVTVQHRTVLAILLHVLQSRTDAAHWREWAPSTSICLKIT